MVKYVCANGEGQSEFPDIALEIEGCVMSLAAFIVIGYLSGSVLYARVFARLFGKENIFEHSSDQNPGTFNAFKLVGFWCGVLTLIFDVLKGFLPVFFYIAHCNGHQQAVQGLSIVLAAPVIGHVFPLFFRFRGGKGIATTFGCLFGLLPVWQPLVVLAVFFIFFSVVLRISPHFHRTIASYLGTVIGLLLLKSVAAVWVGFMIITAAVLLHMLTSPREDEKMRVRFLWMH